MIHERCDQDVLIPVVLSIKQHFQNMTTRYRHHVLQQSSVDQNVNDELNLLHDERPVIVLGDERLVDEVVTEGVQLDDDQLMDDQAMEGVQLDDDQVTDDDLPDEVEGEDERVH